MRFKKLLRGLADDLDFTNVISGSSSTADSLLRSIANTAANTYGAAQQATESMLYDLRNKAAQFESAYSDFYASKDEAENIGLGSDWQTLKPIMDGAKKTLDTAASLRDAHAEPVNEMVGAYGGLGGILRGLGIAPLIAAAAVAGVVAVLIYALSKYSDYRDKLTQIKLQLVREGKLPASALDAPSIIGETGTLLKWGLIGAGLLFFWPRISPTLRRLAKR